MTTFEDFMSELEVVLGGNLVSVELEEKDYRAALSRAIRKYKQYGVNNYSHGYIKVEVEKGAGEISIPAEVNTVVKVIRPYAGADFFSSEDLFVRKAIDEMFTHRARASCGGFDFLQYEFLLQEQERLRRYAAIDVDFNHNKWDHTLTLFNKPKIKETWFIECYVDLSEEQYMDLWWIVEWTRAECLEILGRAYSKFSGGIAGPNSDVQLDGRSMIQESQEIKRGLMEDIENNMSGDVDYYGVYVG